MLLKSKSIGLNLGIQIEHKETKLNHINEDDFIFFTNKSIQTSSII